MASPHRFRWRARLAGGIWLAFSALPVAATEVEPLPQPLTLEDALRLAQTSPHPMLEQAQASLGGARADLAQAEARQGINLSLEGRLRWVEPAEIAADQDHADHQAALRLRKNLYDFGRTAALEAAADAQVKAAEGQLVERHSAYRVLVMRRYFEVLLADMNYALENEALAVAYVDLDKLRNRHELGQVSDLTLLAKQSEYEVVLARRASADGARRAARSRLALALGRPGELPADLVMPELPQVEREAGDYEALLRLAQEHNPTLVALRHRLAAAEQEVEAARAKGRPTLDAELEASAYQRDLGSYDPWRAGVVLSVPLYTGGSVDAAVAQAESARHLAQANLTEAEYTVHQQLLDLWLELRSLGSAREAARAGEEYRELYLDRSRAIYEMELKTDLGDAMVRLTEAQLEQMRRKFDTVLAFEELDALLGVSAEGETTDAEGENR